MPSDPADDLRRAIQLADPRLSRFDPLPRIICLRRFRPRLLRLDAARRQLRAHARLDAAGLCPAHARRCSRRCRPGISAATARVDGSYALKIATKPQHRRAERLDQAADLPQARADPASSSISPSSRRRTSCGCPRPTCARSASSTTCRPATAMPTPGASCRICAFSIAHDGQHLQKWQFKRKTTAFKPLGTENKTVTHYHLAPQDWEDLPGRRAEALLQRDPDQGELALRPLRLRSRRDAGDALPVQRPQSSTSRASSRSASRRCATSGAC